MSVRVEIRECSLGGLIFVYRVASPGSLLLPSAVQFHSSERTRQLVLHMASYHRRLYPKGSLTPCLPVTAASWKRAFTANIAFHGFFIPVAINPKIPESTDWFPGYWLLLHSKDTQLPYVRIALSKMVDLSPMWLWSPGNVESDLRCIKNMY